jgi:hypothetical protein
MSTKLGLHVTQGPRAGYGAAVAAAPAVVLSVGDGGALLEAMSSSGGRTITIYREQTVFHDAPPGIDQMSEGQARRAADDAWPLLRSQYRLNPADYYQTVNETGGDNPMSLRNIVAFEMRLMELAEGDGLKLAVGSPAGGSPGSFDLWEQFYPPLIRRAGMGGHIYSRHAYGGVAAGGNGMLTREGPVAADDNAGRPFREATWLRDRGIHTPMVITEAGQHGGFDFPGVGAFMTDVARYDTLCREHPNVWGFCCWTYGTFMNANMQAASPRLAEYLQSQGGAVRPAYPDPAIRDPFGGPPSTGVQPPELLTHRINLLPPDMTEAEMRELGARLLPTRSAFTFSADAAHALMFAGAPESRVIVWDGHRWPDDIFAWLRARGVKFEARSLG